MNNLLTILRAIPLKSNSTVVFDIDDTLINTKGEIIKPIVDFYNVVKNMGIEPMIVTARRFTKNGLKYTQRQLKEYGITNYKFLYLMPMETNDVWEYKKQARKDIMNNGYNIEMSLGDKPWDIGDYGGIGVIVDDLNKKLSINNISIVNTTVFDKKEYKSYIDESYGNLSLLSSVRRPVNYGYNKMNIPAI